MGSRANWSCSRRARIWPVAAAAQPGIRLVTPARDIDQEGPFRQLAIALQVLERIAWQNSLQCRPEDLGQGQINGPDRAVKVQGPEQFAAHFDEVSQRRQPL